MFMDQSKKKEMKFPICMLNELYMHVIYCGSINNEKDKMFQSVKSFEVQDFEKVLATMLMEKVEKLLKGQEYNNEEIKIIFYGWIQNPETIGEYSEQMEHLIQKLLGFYQRCY